MISVIMIISIIRIVSIISIVTIGATDENISGIDREIPVEVIVGAPAPGLGSA
jgi:hypothetical protein